MMYSTEYNEKGEIVKEYETNEYGDVEITYINEELKDVNTFELFRNVICSFKLELSVNKELYKKGLISKELYEKVADKILEKMKPFTEIIKV